MSLIDENQAELAALDWFESLGYSRVFGPDIGPGGKGQERNSYKEVVLANRLRAAIARINPSIPEVARDDALRRVLHPDVEELTEDDEDSAKAAAFRRWAALEALVGARPPVLD